MKALRYLKICVMFAAAALSLSFLWHSSHPDVSAQAGATATPTPQVFDQPAAIAALRQQIKGREAEPAEKVFNNIQTLKTVPAGRLLAIMEMDMPGRLG